LDSRGFAPFAGLKSSPRKWDGESASPITK
jgi:hypothetical protein